MDHTDHSNDGGLMGRHLVFYRTQVVRVALIVSGAGLAVSFSPWGPKEWRVTPSLLWLHRVLPWPLICILFTLYVLLLVWGSIPATVTADFLGLFLYLSEFAALLLTLHVGQKTNPFAIAGVFLACVLHFAAGRLAIYDMARA